MEGVVHLRVMVANRTVIRSQTPPLFSTGSTTNDPEKPNSPITFSVSIRLVFVSVKTTTERLYFSIRSLKARIAPGSLAPQQFEERTQCLVGLGVAANEDPGTPLALQLLLQLSGVSILIWGTLPPDACRTQVYNYILDS
ncbi:hypothetical protein Leryth_026668 [Lithospermum erythrorhizon]|nr:hypothetical protein Leryth_026668 [Lithospermum erythrorhizon]